MRGGLFWLIGAIILIAVVVFNRPIQEWSTVSQAQSKAQQAVQKRRPDAAIVIYKDALNQYPTNDSLIKGLGELYLGEHEFAQAETIYRKAMERKPHEATWVVGWAKAIVNRPLSAQDLSLLNILRGRLAEFLPKAYNQRTDGSKAFRKADKPPAEALKDIGELLTTLARLYQRSAEVNTGETPEIRDWLRDWAIYYYRLGLQANPEQPEARFYLGLLYQNRNFYKDASREYCNALLMRENLAQARYNMGLSLAKSRLWGRGMAQMHYGIEQLAADGHQHEADNLLRRWQHLKVMYKPAILWGKAHPSDMKDAMNLSCLAWDGPV